MDQSLQGLIAVGVICAALVLLVWAGIVAAQRRKEREANLAAREMATMIEETQVTPGGAICFALLVITVIGSFFAYGKATTIFQQIEAGVSLIAGSILFGLGVAIGRKRTYRIYRSEQRQP